MADHSRAPFGKQPLGVISPRRGWAATDRADAVTNATATRDNTMRRQPPRRGIDVSFSLSFALAILAQTTDGSAGTAYTVRKSGGAFTTQPKEFSVVADAGRIRADAADRSPDTVVLWDTILFNGNGPLIALNSENQTWYELEPPSPFALSSHFLTPLSKGAVETLKLNFDEVAGDARVNVESPDD